MIRRLRKITSCVFVFACTYPSFGQASLDIQPAKLLPTNNSEIDQYNQQYLRLTRTLIHPKSVADTFGKRIG
ncbi:MAG TPA: hypothetical protein VHD85_21090, partial [Terracidiphilus sp.]|nr:hypothetical protein [Terracidiphilus sp.]